MGKGFSFLTATIIVFTLIFTTSNLYSTSLDTTQEKDLGFGLKLELTDENNNTFTENYINQMIKIKNFILLKNKKISPAEAEKITSYLMKYSYKYDIEPELTASIIYKESRFNVKAISPNGAKGLGQLMPHTCKSMGLNDCFEVEGNIKGTVRYIKYLLDLWKNYEKQIEFALASYLLGPNKVKCYNNIIYKPKAKKFIDEVLAITQLIKQLPLSEFD